MNRAWLEGAVRRAAASPRAWLLAAMVALLITFAQPRMNVAAVEHDLLFVIDVTQSMEVADMPGPARPLTRSAAAKSAIEHALRHLPCGSRIGLGLFTEYRSFLLLAPVELCENQRELIAMLGRIDSSMAWSGNSEVAKGLFSGLKIAKALPDRPALVFVTDGHEAPPVNPRYRPDEDGAARAAPGLILGVGGLTPVAIPKLDPEGRAYGRWAAEDVLQVDPRSLGRGGSVAGEQMTEEAGNVSTALVGATPGSEHLSGLREPYLQLLASETGLQYHRLASAPALLEALRDPSLDRVVQTRADLRWLFAVLALTALLAAYRPLSGLRAARARVKRGWQRSDVSPARTDKSKRSSPRPGS